LTALFVALAGCSPQAPAQNVATGAAAEPGAQFGLPQVAVTIHSANGEHVFNAQLAASLQQQERGLMFRRSLAPDEGMLFPYDPPSPVSFWMHNTLIPLDMLFIRADGTIARIATAKALDDTPVAAGEPVAAVLEIRAGRAAELGIRAGDRTDWRH
jgi:uncharacterized membrane protein (UPF0127 family)